MASKQSKTYDLPSVLEEKIDEYTDKFFETTDPELRQKYRAVVKSMQDLFLLISTL